MLAGKTTKEKRCNSRPRGIQNSTVQELIYLHHQELDLAVQTVHVMEKKNENSRKEEDEYR